jgi:hypothetical protein
MNVLQARAIEKFPQAVANLEAAATHLKAQMAAIQSLRESDLSHSTYAEALNVFAASVGIGLLVPSADLNDKQVVEALQDAVMGDARISISVERS